MSSEETGAMSERLDALWSQITRRIRDLEQQGRFSSMRDALERRELHHPLGAAEAVTRTFMDFIDRLDADEMRHAIGHGP